jgi:hypothetical protein
MCHAGHCHADDFTADFVKTADTSYGSIDIEGIFIDHRLDDHWVITADNYTPNGDRTSFTTMNRGVGTHITINGLSGCWKGLHIQKLLFRFGVDLNIY